MSTTIITPSTGKISVSHQTNLGVDSYDLDDLYSPDTAFWKSKVLDIGSPKYEPNKTYAFDRSRYLNHGTISGAVWKQLPSGQRYLDFDGSDDVVELGAFTITGNVATFFFWVKSDTLVASSNKQLIDFRGDSVLALQWFSGASGKLGMYSGAAEDNFGNTPLDGKWHHVVFVLNGTSANAYLDGAAFGSTQTITAMDVDAATDVAIGAISAGAGGGNRFDGGIALTQILRAALTAAEVAGYYQWERHLIGV